MTTYTYYEALQRITLLEDQLRLTEDDLKTTQQERENYYNKSQSLESVCNDMRSKVTSLEHALGDVGEANSSLRAKLNKSENDRIEQVAAIGKQAANYLIELDTLKSRCSSLEDSNSRLRSDLEHLTADRNTWEEHHSYQTQIKDKDAEIAKLKEEVEELYPYYLRHRPSLLHTPEFMTTLPEDVRVGDTIRGQCCPVTEINILYDGTYEILAQDPESITRYRNTYPAGCLVELDELNPEGIPYTTSARIQYFQNLMAAVEEVAKKSASAVTPKTPANAVKYPHYFREVTNTTHIDVNWILKAYNVPCCEGHAIKKLLVSGQRGAKNRMQDLKEARDSIDRAIELEEESK